MAQKYKEIVYEATASREDSRIWPPPQFDWAAGGGVREPQRSGEDALDLAAGDCSVVGAGSPDLQQRLHADHVVVNLMLWVNSENGRRGVAE